MHEPADTEPGRKTAGTVVILAGDTIGAIARTSRETTGTDAFDADGNRVPPAGPVLRGGGANCCAIAAPVGPTHRTQQDIVVDGAGPEPTRLHR
jgi:hypothetical protein